MKKTILKTCFVVLALLQFSVVGYPQLVPDPYTIPQKAYYRSWDGLLINPTENYKLLTIMVNICYDMTTDPVAGSSYWAQIPASAASTVPSLNVVLPTYMTDLLDTEYNLPTLHGTMTRKYHESSFGNLYLIGDFVVVNLKQSEIAEPDGKFTFTQIHNAAISLINQQGLNTLFTPEIFSDYDSDGDGEFDVVQYIFRNTDRQHGTYDAGNGQTAMETTAEIIINGTAHGIKWLSATSVGSIDLSQQYNHVFYHEFSHLLFGSNEFHTSGGHSWGGVFATTFLGVQGGYGLMGAANTGLTSCNGYERWRMHWKSSIYNQLSNQYIVANNQVSDITAEDGNKTFLLRDFVTTGDAIRIKLPYNDPGSPTQYIWLENHKMGMNDKLDVLFYSNTHTCRPQGKPGIYAYYQIGKDILESFDSTVVYPDGLSDNLKIISAEGNFDFLRKDDTVLNCVVSGDFPNLKQIKENPFTGTNSVMKTGFRSAGSPVLTSDFVFPWKKTNLQGASTDSLPFLMSERDPFRNTGQLSIATNPAPFNALVYNNDALNNSSIVKTSLWPDNQTIYLSGLAIHYQRLANHDYQVSVEWDNFLVDNDRVWCGTIVAPKRLEIGKNTTITLDQGTTVQTINRVAATGVFADLTQLSLEPEADFTMFQGAGLNLLNKSKVIFKSGSKTLIADDAWLTINSGTTLEIEACATVIVKGTGKIEAKSGGTLKIHPGANLSFDSPQNLVLNSGFLTGGGMAITPTNFWTMLNQPPSLTIPTGNTTWQSGTYVFNSNLVIPGGAVLTISNSTLRFAPETKITVSRGGRLVLNNTVVTNQSCFSNQFWEGIEVVGTTSLPQPNVNQGWLVINGGRIENARYGVKTFRYDPNPDGESSDPVWGGVAGYSGGVVQATQATFRNNSVALIMAPYPLISHSFFDQCIFETNATLADGTYPDYFVKMNGMSGVKFYGCTFRNTLEETGYEPLKRGGGIYAYNSDVYVRSSCNSTDLPCPEANIVRGEFTRLNRGIYALSTGTHRPVEIDRNNFNFNYASIYLSGRDYAFIARNTIKPYNETETGTPQTYGVYLDQCKGYHIEANTFNSTNPLRRGIGLIVHNSGERNNEVYNNTFYNLNYGTEAQYNNRSSDGLSGLCYKCNDFQYNTVDVLVSPINPQSVGNTDGIAAYQGDSIAGDNTSPAGNTFSNMPGYFSLTNNANPIVYYRHYNTNNAPIIPSYSGPVYPRRVTGTSYVKQTSCPSKLSSGGSQEEKDAMDEASAEAESLSQQRLLLLDGGGTDDLVTDVTLATTTQTTQLQQQLLSLSPYLTDTVLSASIAQEEALPNAALRDVMVANPTGARSEKLLEKIDQRSDPMPDYLYNQIVDAGNKPSPREVLETAISAKRQKSYFHWSTLNRLLWSGNEPSDSLRSIWYTSPLVESRFNLAFVALNNGGYAEATAWLDTVSNSLQYASTEKAEAASMQMLLNVMQRMESDTINPNLPDSVSVMQLQELVSNGSMAGIYARNILQYAGFVNYQEPILVENQMKSASAGQFRSTRLVKKDELLTVYPNPANTYFIAEVHAASDKLLLRLTDNIGKVHQEYEVKHADDQVIINTNHLPAGLYYLCLWEDSRLVSTVKVTVQ